MDLADLSEERAREALLHALATSPITVGDRRDRTTAARAARASRPLPPPIWNVPQRNAAFTGRGRDPGGAARPAVRRAPTVVVPQALYGLGGVGKTQVALEYAHRFAADYDIVWWISAEQPGQVRSELAELADPLGLPKAETVDESVRRRADALRQGRAVPPLAA